MMERARTDECFALVFKSILSFLLACDLCGEFLNLLARRITGNLVVVLNFLRIFEGYLGLGFDLYL